MPSLSVSGKFRHIRAMEKNEEKFAYIVVKNGGEWDTSYSIVKAVYESEADAKADVAAKNAREKRTDELAMKFEDGSESYSDLTDEYEKWCVEQSMPEVGWNKYVSEWDGISEDAYSRLYEFEDAHPLKKWMTDAKGISEDVATATIAYNDECSPEGEEYREYWTVEKKPFYSVSGK